MWHKNAQKLSAWKTRRKFPVTTLGFSMVKIGHLDDAFLEVFFLTASKLSRRLITAAKRKEKEKRKGKKIFKIKKPKDIGHFLIQNLKILILAHAWAKLLQNMMLVERKSSCHVANVFSTGLNLQKFMFKMFKKCVFGKKLQESMG